MLQSYNYKFYDINPKDGKGLPLVEPADLLTAHPEDSSSQTDLMLLRGGPQPPKE